MVLGVQWLRKLGTVQCNWDKLTMDFLWKGEQHHLQGIKEQPIKASSFRVMAKEFRAHNSLFAICVEDTSSVFSDGIHPEMKLLLDQFPDIYQKPSHLPPEHEINHRINLKEGTDPINVRPYRYAHFQKAEIEKQVYEMLKFGFIQASTSPFSSPVLLVRKKDGTWRFCTDYRALNEVTIRDRFPIPTVDDMLDELYGATYFTKLDFVAGFHQVRVHSTDVHKTAFRTHNGHYEYLVMPFGLCNAPSTFQALMNTIFRAHLRKFVLVFFDDVLIYSPTWESHLQHVRTAFELLRQHQFYIKLSKCAFGQQQIEYLGHIVSCNGVQVDQGKIQVMINWPKPTNVSDLRGFLGLTGYYRKFVRDYGTIARPLTNLLKKGQFLWTEDADDAFTVLKKPMASIPILAMPNFEAPFVITTDASNNSIGVVLSQQDRPIAFMSRALGVSKQSWSTYAKEMLAILQAIRTWRPYLLGRKFYIQTDQRSLKYMVEQRVITPEQQKWVSKLLGYDYEIIYKPGKENTVANALSRITGSPSLNALFIPHTSLWDQIKATISTHPYMIKLGRLASENPGVPYSWRNGLILYKNRVVVPPKSDLTLKIL